MLDRLSSFVEPAPSPIIVAQPSVMRLPHPHFARLKLPQSKENCYLHHHMINV